METLYQIMLTLIVSLVGAILWASTGVFKNLFIRVFLQILVVLAGAFMIVEYIWSDFSFGEIITFVFRNLLGWGILLGGAYLLITFGLLREFNTKISLENERLKKKLRRR